MDEPATNDLVKAPSSPKAKADAIQLTLTPFVTEVNMAATDAAEKMRARAEMCEQEPLRFFPELGLLLAVDEVAIPAYLSDWLRMCGATRVDVPGDGHCYYTVLAFITQAKEVKHTYRMTPALAKEVAYMRLYVNGTLGQLQPWRANGSIHLAQMYESKVDNRTQPEEAVALALVQAQIARARDCDANKPAHYDLWAGSEEIRATAAWIREPIMVFDVQLDHTRTEKVTGIVLYRVAPSPVVPGTERVREDIVEPKEAYKLLRHYISQRTLPLVLIREHSQEADGRQIGHFAAFRFPQPAYECWSQLDGRSRTMRERMNDAHAGVGLDAILQAEPPLDKTPLAVFESASEWVPSSQEDEEAFLTPPSEPRATRSTDVNPSQYDVLMNAMGERGEPAVKGDPVWQRCHAGNQHCFRAWKRQVQLPAALATALRGPEITTREASSILWEAPLTWVDMVRRLPYPELLLAQLKPSKLVIMAKSVLLAVHARLVRASACPPLSPAAQTTLDTWVEAVEEASSVPLKWRIAYGPARWKTLAQEARLAVGRPQDLATTEARCCKLVLVLLCLSRTLAEVLQRDDVMDQIYLLLRWMQRPDHEHAAVTAALHVDESKWHGLRGLIVARPSSPSLTGVSPGDDSSPVAERS